MPPRDFTASPGDDGGQALAPSFRNSQVMTVQSSLGHRLDPLLDSGFFRPLARPSAPVYVDCAARLVEAALESGQLDRAEARALVREVIEQYPGVVLEDDEGGFAVDPQQKATQFFNKLLEA